MHRRERHLGRRDQPQVVALDVVGVVGELGQVPRRSHRLGEHDGRWADLLVVRRVAVDGEGRQRAEQARARPAVEREHGAGQPCPAFHVEQLQGLADLPVRHLLVVRPARLGTPEVLPRPPPADLDVVVLALPVGRVLGWDVGEEEQSDAHLLLRRVGLGGGRALVCTEGATAGAELGGLGVVALLLGLPDLTRELLDLRPHRLRAPHPLQANHVGPYHRVHLRRLHAAPSQRSLHPVGILTQHPDIDHPCSK